MLGTFLIQLIPCKLKQPWRLCMMFEEQAQRRAQRAESEECGSAVGLAARGV